MNNLKLDKKGLEQLKKELMQKQEELANTRIYKGTKAIYQGDNWHDNPELYQTESEERSLMAQIDDLRKQIENVTVIEDKLDSDSLDIDNYVVLDVEYAPDDIEEDCIFKLIGSSPNRMSEIQEISVNSPMGNAIYGKKVGDEISYKVENNVIKVLIKKIMKRTQDLDVNTLRR